MNTNLTLLGLFALTASLSGCGPSIVENDAPANERGGSASFGQTSDASSSCASETILPTDDRVLDGTQRYAACASRGTKPTSVKIVGYSSSSDRVCAFPIQYVNSTQYIYKLDSYGQPVYQCYDGFATADHSTNLDFGAANFNGFVIVDENFVGAMSSCLIAGSSCPVHSIGQFR